jgi:Protein of unknown function (DUF1592)/Protein of unknown function (DUF1588)/Protein of unknown function (DUF1585)/Protein of unknown function (DUF1587)/Planctomycete cytochrome C
MRCLLLFFLLATSFAHAEERCLLAADNQVIEIDRRGKAVSVLKHPGHGGIYDAARLGDGGIAYAHRGGLAVFDASKKLIMEHKAVAGPKGAEANSVAVLEGGKKFALVDSGMNQIRIVDQSGAVVSETPLPDLKDDPLHFRYRMIREVSGENAFWVGQYGRKTVLKVQTGTGRVLQSIPLEPLLKPSTTVKKAFATLQAEDGSLWIATSTGCQLLHLDAAGQKLGCWTTGDLGLQCRYLLGMSPLANGNLLLACGDYHLQKPEEGRDLIAEIDQAGKVVWKLTRDQLVDQIDGYIDKKSGLEELHITNVHVFESPTPKSAATNPIHSFIDKHCIDCHDDSVAKGDFDITALAFDLGHADTRGRWTRVFDLIDKGEMPPPEKSKVSDEERKAVVSQLSASLLAAAQAETAKNGRGPVRRLTRVEFENNLRALLKLPHLDIRDKLPEDRDAHGFTKVSALLDMSHVQLDAYLEATETALRTAMAGPKPPEAPVTQRFTGTELFPGLNTFGEREAMFFARDNRMVPITNEEVKTMTPEQRRDPSLEMALFRSATWPYYGYPPGFRAKQKGAYRVRFRGRAVRQVRDFRLMPAHEPVAMSFRARQPSGPDVSGDVRETGGWMDLQPEARDFETTIHLKAGETFEYSPLGLPVPFIRTDGGFFYDYPPMPPEGHRGVAIQWLEVTGPISEAQWPPRSHHVLFDEVNAAKGNAADAEKLFRRFAAMAALRPMSEEDHQPFLKLILAKITAGASFSDAMLAGNQALLCSSHCLYLTEPRKDAPDAHFAIASRLSHFLWNSRLDDELAQLAKKGRLHDKAVLRAQTERLIADPRFEQFVRTFAEEWLDLRKLRRDIPDERLYPEYRKDDYLVDSMAHETQSFLRAMIRENLPASTVIAADFTFVNDRLAAHYDLPRVSGSAMQRVTLPKGSPYGGLITQAALMKHTANGTTTSPVLRGVWIMEKLLGQPPPPPPKSVPAVEPDIRGATTIRALLAKHTESKTCASCHAKFDPVGFALENFDVMGAWRDRYRGMEKGEKITGFDPAGHPYTYFVGQPVDASSKLPTGETFHDIHELKRLLAAHPRQLAKNLLEHLVLHATGTPVSFADREEIEAMLDACAADGFRVKDLIHALVQNRIFTGGGVQ